MSMSPEAQAIENKRVAQRINQKGLGKYADALAEEISQNKHTIIEQQKLINQLRQELDALKQDFIIFKFSNVGSGLTSV